MADYRINQLVEPDLPELSELLNGMRHLAEHQIRILKLKFCNLVCLS